MEFFFSPWFHWISVSVVCVNRKFYPLKSWVKNKLICLHKFLSAYQNQQQQQQKNCCSMRVCTRVDPMAADEQLQFLGKLGEEVRDVAVAVVVTNS